MIINKESGVPFFRDVLTGLFVKSLREYVAATSQGCRGIHVDAEGIAHGYYTISIFKRSPSRR
jgi:hypothetical protein